MRDGTVIELGAETLIITSDNSGAIGMKEQDHVAVPYDVVSYYAFRVAVMENIALGGVPVSVVMHNFCGDREWEALVSGVERGKRELGFNHEITITGSSETNMPMLQSALGVVVVGKRKDELPEVRLDDATKFAVIGKPLVGDKVVKEASEIAPLDLFCWISEQDGVQAVLPVGSKGILYELNELVEEDVEVEERMVRAELDLYKSSGPATCFIVAYDGGLENHLRKRAGLHFNRVEIVGGQARA
ncbi:ATP-binding protein [Pseudalkalibacillus hwajinpoensis]|uniref:ATP-binding protein n=1 Tax=Guptibacillus hwajinpoensis TaxID=208199 RepID=UPI001CD5AA9C|nr:ATP-binding protein [Pseudalkalibacillus hwajinpoensis]MCA0991326.1 ATP-binding protein [Pseudalkalibacillus hwajinpoensis]